MQPYTYLQHEAELFSKQLIASRIGQNRYFHNIEHTQLVVKSCRILVEHETYAPVDYAALIVAAWFHDTGYTVVGPGHEFESVKIVSGFLESFNCEKQFIALVVDLILSTRVNFTPAHYLAEILCDADLSHLGSPEYKRWEFRLRHELEYSDGISKTDKEWLEQNISFFKSHDYYTPQARKLWGIQKDQNLRLLELNLVRTV
ncbi:HD domain-containing protein [Chryseolinea sp. T2]|uniref:HD domain-containing protein n=1 Tax=Chryseolinea sp. T2 TaxID=3129255 RepID=UPI0030786185